MSRDEHPLSGVKSTPHFNPLLDSLKWTHFSLALHLCSSYVITKWCIIYIKTDSWFQNHMRNLDKFWQAVESPKGWNSMGYLCPKNTFLLLKYIHRIYLTLLSTTVKLQKISYVIFKTLSHFPRHNSVVYF